MSKFEMLATHGETFLNDGYVNRVKAIVRNNETGDVYGYIEQWSMPWTNPTTLRSWGVYKLTSEGYQLGHLDGDACFEVKRFLQEETAVMA